LPIYFFFTANYVPSEEGKGRKGEAEGEKRNAMGVALINHQPPEKKKRGKRGEKKGEKGRPPTLYPYTSLTHAGKKGKRKERGEEAL